MQNMKEKLLSEKIIHADETVFQVLHEKGRKATTDSRMWVYCNAKFNDRSNIIFDYHPARKSENAVRFIGEFDRFLVCDGYTAYNALQNAKRCGCLTMSEDTGKTHCQRKNQHTKHLQQPKV